MNIRGYCFFSKLHNEHLIVIISGEDADGKALAVPLSSIKFNSYGKHTFGGQQCSYYDPSCTLQNGDIVTEEGRQVLNRPTFALYQMAAEIASSEIYKFMASSMFDLRCQVSAEILTKLQEGAKKSDELAERFQKYFEYF